MLNYEVIVAGAGFQVPLQRLRRHGRVQKRLLWNRVDSWAER